MKILLGPEILWIALYSVAKLIARANVPPSPMMDRFIERGWLWVPMLALLTFGLWWIPAIEKNWLLLRVWIACVVGGHFVLETTMGAYSEQGPGIGTAYILGMILLFCILVAGSIFVKIKF